MHEAIYGKMKDAAHRRKALTYGDLAPLANLEMGNPGDRTKMAQILDEISSYEHAAKRPLLSALVVRGDSAAGGLPGGGFFTLAKRLGVQTAKMDDLEFFVTELNRVYAHWSSSQ